MRSLDARVATVIRMSFIRIDAMWLAADPVDMRAGADRLIARVVQVFGAAQAHHGYPRFVVRHTLTSIRQCVLADLYFCL